MRMRRLNPTVAMLALALGCSLTFGVAPVTAQETVDARMERIRAALPEPAMEQIEARVRAARTEGLPVEPLLDKALEGISKRVPGDRIVGAVDQLATQLGRAHSLLGDGVPPAAVDVAAVADALRRGVPEDAVRRIAQRAGPEEPVALAVHTVGDLMDQGVPAGQALAVLEAWRGRGARVQELRELPAAVERLIRQGTLPSQAAAAVTGAMQQGGPPGGGPGMGPGGQGGGPGMGAGGGQGNGPPIPPGAGPPDDRGKGQGNGNGTPPEGGPPGGG